MEVIIRKMINFLWSLLPYGSYLGEDFSSETAFKQAESDKLDVVIPTKHQIQIDIDGPLGSLTYARNFDKFAKFYHVVDCLKSPSKSGAEGREHITLTLEEEVGPKERLILQAFLGSDLTREFLGLQRIKTGDGVPTLFLEKHTEPVKEIDCDIPF